jgi:hypothetical protein
MTMRPALDDLVLSAFEAGAWRRWLARQERYACILSELAPHSSPAALVCDSLDALAQRGMLDAELIFALARERPHRGAELTGLLNDAAARVLDTAAGDAWLIRVPPELCAQGGALTVQDVAGNDLTVNIPAGTRRRDVLIGWSIEGARPLLMRVVW